MKPYWGISFIQSQKQKLDRQIVSTNFEPKGQSFADSFQLLKYEICIISKKTHI